MKYTIVAALALACAQSAFGLTVNTPSNVVQCQPILLSWSDGTGPFYPSIIPGGQPSAPAIKSFDVTDKQSLTWVVDVPANTGITIALKDSTGAIAYTDIVTVQAGSDQSCMNGSSTAGGATPPAASGAPPAPTAGSTTAGSGSSAAGSGSTTAGSGSAAAASASNASSARPTGTQGAAASAKPSSGAVRTSVSYGLAGVLAAAGLALF